jgi:hypothetical protein
MFVHYSSIFWRKAQSKCASLSCFWLLALQSARPRLRRASPPRGSAGPARRGRPWSVGPHAVGPSRANRPSGPLLSCRVQRVHGPGCADRAARPLASLPYRCHVLPILRPLSRGAQGNTPTTALLTYKCRPAYARAHCAIAGPLPPRHG